MAPPVIRYTENELADLVWLKTGWVPVSVRTQAMLVISTFEDGSLAVHRIDDLER